jgi:hypothetical protein
MVPVYSAGRQNIKVRMVLWASVAVFAVCIWQGWSLFHTYGLRAADGGQLASLGVRLAWGLGLGLLGTLVLAGLATYGRCYVAAIRYDATRQVVELDTPRLTGTRTQVVRASDVTGGHYYAGRLQTAGSSVNAPWTSLRIRGRRLPFILDEQGTVLDAALLTQLRKQATRPGQAARRSTTEHGDVA